MYWPHLCQHFSQPSGIAVFVECSGRISVNTLSTLWDCRICGVYWPHHCQYLVNPLGLPYLWGVLAPSLSTLSQSAGIAVFVGCTGRITVHWYRLSALLSSCFFNLVVIVLTTLGEVSSSLLPHNCDRLGGLVVKASASRAEGPGFESRLRRDFSGSSHTSDLKIGTPVATLPGAWRYRVSAGTGRPGVSIL